MQSEDAMDSLDLGQSKVAQLLPRSVREAGKEIVSVEPLARRVHPESGAKTLTQATASKPFSS